MYVYAFQNINVFRALKIDIIRYIDMLKRFLTLLLLFLFPVDF